MNDLILYLQYAGATTFLVNNLSDASRQASELVNPIIVSEERQKKITASINELHKVFAEMPDVTHVLIAQGQRRYARMEAPDVLVVDGNTARMESLLRAVAAAASRESLEIFYQEMEKELIPEENITPTVTEARAAGRLILVAEDDAINQKVILRQLALLGYAAEVASDGQEALRLWREGEYALLLTDLHMPEIDGYGLTETIRREERGQRIPILALTANALRGEIRRAIKAGMDEYLTKPAQLKELAFALEKWMPAMNEPDSLPAMAESGAVNTNLPVDLNVLKSLVGNDPNILRQLLGDYTDSTRQIVSELREAVGAGDVKCVGHAAHKLKSSSRSMGALVFSDLCAELENAVKAENLSSIDTLMAQFDCAWKEVDMAISTMLNGVIT
jgi:CheY-like chemotaxis protein